MILYDIKYDNIQLVYGHYRKYYILIIPNGIGADNIGVEYNHLSQINALIRFR